MRRYLFILCPNYSGSTLLWKLIATSPHVSALPDEGQFLPEVKEVMRIRPWDTQQDLPWADIKAVWERYWDPGKPVSLEKSPPNLIRTDAIRRHFDPVSFVVMVRDPYAHCEGLMRRNGSDARSAAEFTLRCLRAQRANATNLPGVIHFTYEALCADPGGVCRRLVGFLPELEALDHTAHFKVHAIVGGAAKPIADMNAIKLRELAPSDIRTISAVLSTDPDTLAFWGYPILRPGLDHTLGHAMAVARRSMTRLKRLHRT